MVISSLLSAATYCRVVAGVAMQHVASAGADRSEVANVEVGVLHVATLHIAVD